MRYAWWLVGAAAVALLLTFLSVFRYGWTDRAAYSTAIGGGVVAVVCYLRYRASRDH